MLHETGTMELVLISSFRHEYLHRAKALSPKIAIAVLVRDSHPTDLIPYLQACSAAAYHPEKHLCDAELVSWLHRVGICVNCWTVNRSEQAKHLMAIGAGVITDPSRCVPFDLLFLMVTDSKILSGCDHSVNKKDCLEFITDKRKNLY